MRGGLRAQLAVQVAVGVASVVLLFLLLRTYIVQEEVDRTSRGRQAVGQVLANYVDAQLADQLQQLARTAARLPQTGAPTVALEDLRSRLDASAIGVFVLDGSGGAVAADPPNIGAVGVAVARRSEVADALGQNRAAVSGVHAGPGGRPQVGLLVPARVGGAAGAVGLIVDPTNRRFAELVESSVSLGGQTGAEVVDQAGVVVASSQRERVLLTARFPNLYGPAARAREATRAIATAPTGEQELVVYTPLRNAPWGLALFGPEAEVLAPIRRWDPPLVAIVVASLAILVGLAVLTARSVIRPVQLLIGAAHRIAHGDLNSAVPPAGGELQRLSTALEEMRVGLRDAEMARQEVDRLKDEFISSVSHELRTPLGYIKGYTTTLLRDDIAWDDETIRQFLEIIDDSSDQLEGLVDGLLDMSRISEGALSVVPEPVGVLSLIQDVQRRANVRSAAHPIEIDVPPDLPPVMADAVRVQQVIGNLVDNAIKYSPDGGAVTISAEPRGDEVVVAVRDRGIGIPEDQLQTVFDRFHRGRSRDVQKIRGVGLGLPISRGIVAAHGGRIWAERAPDRGSIFRFTLPITREDELAELSNGTFDR